MKLSELEAINAKTRQALNEGRADVARPDLFPFYGFYEADIFECPPFLMFTANDCPRALNILFARSFEPMSMKLWCRLARHASGILDIGAHVGVYGLAAASLRKDISIHAFEPNPHAYTRLRMHKLMNAFDNLVEHTVAAGDQNHFVNFAWARKRIVQISSGGHVAENGGGGESVVVPMRMLDGSGIAAVLGRKGLIKVDVEGGEIRTFKGMREVLALTPDIILETFSQDACDAINAQILPLGYRVYHICEEKGRLDSRDKLRPCDPSSDDFNQFLSVRSPEEIAALTT